MSSSLKLLLLSSLVSITHTSILAASSEKENSTEPAYQEFENHYQSFKRKYESLDKGKEKGEADQPAQKRARLERELLNSRGLKKRLGDLRKSINSSKLSNEDQLKKEADLIDFYFEDHGYFNPKLKDLEVISRQIKQGNMKASYAAVRLLVSDPHNPDVANLLKPEDIDRLKKYLENGKDQEDARAFKRNLGWLYTVTLSNLLEENRKHAIETLEEAIQEGDVQAPRILGDFYSALDSDRLFYPERYKAGENVLTYDLQDEEDSENWWNANPRYVHYYELGSDRGDPLSSYKAGDLLQNGLESDGERSVRYFKKAGKRGYHEGFLSLAELYTYGGESQSYPLIGEESIMYLLLYRAKSPKPIDRSLSILYNYLDISLPYEFPLKTEDRKKAKRKVKDFRENAEETYGVLLDEKLANDKTSTRQSFNHPMLLEFLFPHYKNLTAYLRRTLKLFKSVKNPGFMVSLAKIIEEPEDGTKVETQGPFLRAFKVKGETYLTFGKKNVKKAGKLMAIVDDRDKNQKHALHSLQFLQERVSDIQKKYQIKLMSTQQKTRLFGTEEQKDKSAQYQELIEHNEKLLTAFENVRNLRANLVKILQEHAPLRNSNFAKHYKLATKDSTDGELG